MASLLEMQRAFARALVGDGVAAACAGIARDGIAPESRLAVHRQTFQATLTNALRVAFPATRRLIGDECFAGAAWHYVRAEPPRSAWLDEYGTTFPAFLRHFAPLRTLAYLADVASVECAVNRALHAPDAPALAAAALAAVGERDRAKVAFVAHPSVGIVACRFAADAIWRAVLSGDDAAIAALDVRPDPVVLLVERRAGVEVTRVPLAHARLTVDLLGGTTLGEAVGASEASAATAVLAEHLARGRFTAFRVSNAPERNRHAA